MTVITASPKGFQKLLDLQQKSLDSLTSIQNAIVSNADSIQMEYQKDQLNVSKQQADIQQALLDVAKDQADKAAENAKNQARAFAEVAKGLKTFKTFGDRLNDMKKGFSDAFSGGNLAQTLMKSMNVGGIFSKKIAKGEFVQAQQAMGDKRNKKEIKKDFEAANILSKQLNNVDKDINDLKKLLGRGAPVTDEQLRSSGKGAALLDKRDEISVQYAKVDKTAGMMAGVSAPLPGTPSDSGKVPKSTSTKAAEAATSKEDKNEMLKVLGDQTSLLQQIATNTGGGDKSKAGGKEDSGGGGIMGGIAAGLKSLGGGLKSLGAGAGKGIRSLLFGIAQGLAAFANPATLVGLAAVSVSIMAIGKALQWAAPAFEAMAPIFIKIADVIGNVFMTAIKAVPDVVKSIGGVIVQVVGAITESITSVINGVTTSIERIANIDATNLAQVGLAMLGISSALIAFGAANVGAGLANLVTSFLGAVSGGSPIDQLERLANMSAGLMDAAKGIEAIAAAMQGFANVNPDSMKAINDFPWVRATAFVAAGGGMMMTNGAKIYAASKGNADESAKVDAKNASGGGNTTAVVNAPVQNNTNTTQIIKPSARNQESSQSRYLSARY